MLAQVGSYSFFDRDSKGQVDGTNAHRSPGSTLKPFIYGLAIDRGLITSESLLNDVPIDYSGYKPVNYDAEYRGYVTAREALAHSLNVPAVNLYAQLGNNGIYSFLQNAGISTLPKSKGHYGLSLILGGCELTLLELTTLYAGLANSGEFAKYRLTTDRAKNKKEDSLDRLAAISERRAPAKRLLSREACYILTEMLTEVRRPDLPAAYEASTNLPKIAWKTGTSYGHPRCMEHRLYSRLHDWCLGRQFQWNRRFFTCRVGGCGADSVRFIHGIDHARDQSLVHSSGTREYERSLLVERNVAIITLPYFKV